MSVTGERSALGVRMESLCSNQQLRKGMEHSRTRHQDLLGTKFAAAEIAAASTGLSGDEFGGQYIPRMQILLEVAIQASARHEADVDGCGPHATNISYLVDEFRDAT